MPAFFEAGSALTRVKGDLGITLVGLSGNGIVIKQALDQVIIDY